MRKQNNKAFCWQFLCCFLFKFTQEGAKLCLNTAKEPVISLTHCVTLICSLGCL